MSQKHCLDNQVYFVYRYIEEQGLLGTVTCMPTTYESYRSEISQNAQWCEQCGKLRSSFSDQSDLQINSKS